MASSVSFLRQLSGKEAWRSSSWRWGTSGSSNNTYCSGSGENSYCEGSLGQMEGLNNMYGGDNGGMVMRKRVMVLVDQTTHSKQAMMWALTHLANKGDLLTLLNVIPPPQTSSLHDSSSSSYTPFVANSLGSLCKAIKPEVEVEALVIQGPRLATVLSQVKKLEVSVLVLGQKKPSPFISCFCGSNSTEEFVEQCINSADCLTIGVRKQSKGMGGYIISTRSQRNFWLLA